MYVGSHNTIDYSAGTGGGPLSRHAHHRCGHVWTVAPVSGLYIYCIYMTFFFLSFIYIHTHRVYKHLDYVDMCIF